MDNVCANCHWYKPEREHANIINCLEHFNYHDKTDTCSEFCEDGKYVPTGIWASVTKVVEAVADAIEQDKQET